VVAVEAALVSTMLFTILAGVVDVSMLFRTTYEVSSASRAGARLAAQEPLAPTFAHDAAVQVATSMEGMDYSQVTKLWVYKANPNSPTGEPASDSNCTSGVKCVRFTLSADVAGHPVVSPGTGTWTGRKACAFDPVAGVDQVDAVGVRVQYRHHAPIMFGDGHLVQETTTMRLEQLSTALVCSSP
jgi:Flp pilus assembly protein TadG